MIRVLFALAALLALPEAAVLAQERPAASAQEQQAAPVSPAAPRKTQAKKKKKAKAARKQARKKKQEPAPQAAAQADSDCGKLDPGLCEKDEDCICSAKGCFKGSKQYYDRCVDKEENCLDYCWARLLDKPYAMKCVDHKCESTTAP